MNNKSKAKQILTFLFNAFISAVFALIILSAISTLYTYTGIHITNDTGATDYVWQRNQIMINMKEGFSLVKMDENGFNNANTFNSIDILLMGSSHMEAYQVNQNENCAALLNDYLPDFNTYNIGISGHTIYRIADNLDSALKEYTPSKYVLIETNTIELDADKMNEVLNNKASAIKSYDDGILFYLQKIPAFKPLYNQIDNWLNVKPAKENNYYAEETIISEEYLETLEAFLKKIKEDADKYSVEPIIFYAPNESLDSSGNIHFSTDSEYYDAYKTICKSLGIIFVDMTDSFNNLYEDKNVLAHGFSNGAVGTGHLNKYGHQAIAETLAAEITAKEGE